MSLLNQAMRLAELEHVEEAMATGVEAVEIYRELTLQQPDQFRPELALSLTFQSTPLTALGRVAEALAATSEAVEIYRELVSQQPDKFRPELATSLILQGLTRQRWIDARKR